MLAKEYTWRVKKIPTGTQARMPLPTRQIAHRSGIGESHSHDLPQPSARHLLRLLSSSRDVCSGKSAVVPDPRNRLTTVSARVRFRRKGGISFNFARQCIDF